MIIAIVVVLGISLAVAIIGLVFLVGVGTSGDSGTPTDSSATSTPAPLPATNENNQNEDVNIKYYQGVAKHAFAVDDLVRTDRISEPVLSPDEKWMAFTRYVYKLVFQLFYTFTGVNPTTNTTF